MPVQVIVVVVVIVGVLAEELAKSWFCLHLNRVNEEEEAEA